MNEDLRWVEVKADWEYDAVDGQGRVHGQAQRLNGGWKLTGRYPPPLPSWGIPWATKPGETI